MRQSPEPCFKKQWILLNLTSLPISPIMRSPIRYV